MRIKEIIKSNIGFIAAMLFLLLMVFNPSAKAWLLSGLMKIGLFQPSVEQCESSSQPLLPEGIIFKDVQGNPVHLTELKDKVLFINFWATWCPPCIAEMPSINKLYLQFKDNQNVVFLMVDVDNDLAKSTAFLNKNKYDFPLFTPMSSIPETVFDGTLPTTLIVDKAGKIVFDHKGGADYSNPDVIRFLTELSE